MVVVAPGRALWNGEFASGETGDLTWATQMDGLACLADLEDLGAAVRADAFGGRAAVLHRDLLGVLDLLLSPALNAIAFQILPPPSRVATGNSWCQFNPLAASPSSPGTIFRKTGTSLFERRQRARA